MVNRRSALAIAILLAAFHCALQQRLSVELAALIQLRSSLGLRSKEWPRKSDPCSTWFGIQCREGRVVSIDISGFKRTRLGRRNPQFSVDAIANLTRLETFNASNFALPGAIPDWFGQQLGTLEVLDLRFASINGVIPPSLGNLTRLRTLILSKNNLSGTIPSTLGQLLGLNTLDLSGNSLTGATPIFFSSLSNLSFLDISSNSLVGAIPPGIGILFNLEYLNLSHNSLVSSLPSQLGDFSRLIDLDLSSNSLSGPLPSEWRGLRSLQKLLIADNNFAGTLPTNLFPSLSRLQLISMSHNNFSGELPDDLWGMRLLRFLDVSGNSLTGSLPGINLRGETRNGTFNLSGNLFYGRLSDDVNRFALIDLSRNFFEGPVPNGMLNNASLEFNCLQHAPKQRSIEACQSFYAQRNLSFDNSGNNTQNFVPDSGNNHRNLILLVGILGGSVLFVLLLVLLILLFICFRHRVGTGHRGNGVGPVPVQGTSPTPDPAINFSNLGELLTYQQLLLATDEFSNSNLIKLGHSGDLFRGVLENGVAVVVKRVDIQSVRKESYLSELELFSKVSHARIVPLIGSCLDNANQKFLVYKYMPNGDLSSSLYRKVTLDDGTLQSLDWITRLKIAIGAAEGLSYLHHECIPPLVHRDVRASSILLDDKFDVRLGSLSNVCVQEGDVHHSRISRFLRLQQTAEQGSSGSYGSAIATCSYDVYCFGKVLLELVTGKMGLSTSNEASTKEWIEKSLTYISIYDKDLITKIIDPSLIIYEDLLEEVWAMAIVARSCLNPRPRKRPLMRYILKALENPLKVVREENTGSARLRATSSLGSWNAALFGSWRQSSSDAAAIQAASLTRGEGVSGTKQQGVSGFEGSGGEFMSSQRRVSVEVLPEEEAERDVVG